MPALVAGTHVLLAFRKDVNDRDKPGHDNGSPKSNDHTRKGARSSGVASSLVAVAATN
jgi:hypothetical protein